MADGQDKTSPPTHPPSVDSTSGAPPQVGTDPLKVFISYSRADIAFADELDLALRDRGFSPIIDRHGIDAGEKWRERLHELIFSCDTVVFILTDSSADSDICAWEAREAARLDKRILVVTLDRITAASPPPELAAINWIACWRDPNIPGSSWTQGLIELDEALRTDLAWLRQRTRLEEQATLWQKRSDTTSRTDYDATASSMLLRGNVLAEALDWTAHKPANATIPETVARFLQASESHEANVKAEAEANLQQREQAIEASKRASRRLRIVSLAGLAFACALIALNGFVSSELSRTQSNIVAAQARKANDDGNFVSAALLALHADPAAKNGWIERLRFSKNGYPDAMAELQRSVLNLAPPNRRSKWQTEFRTIGYSNAEPLLRAELTGGGRGDVVVRNLMSGEIVSKVSSDGSLISSPTFSPDGSLLLTHTIEGYVQVWDTLTGQKKFDLSHGHNSEVSHHIVSNNGSKIVTASRQNSLVTVWDAHSGVLVRNVFMDDDTRATSAIATDHDGARVAIAPYSDSIAIYDVTTDKILTRIANPERAQILSLDFSPDGTRIISGDDRGVASIWDAETGELLRSLDNHRGEIHFVRYHPSGRWVVSGGRNTFFRVWDPRSLRVQRDLPRGLRVLGFSSSGLELLTASRDDISAWPLARDNEKPYELVQRTCEKLVELDEPLSLTEEDLRDYGGGLLPTSYARADKRNPSTISFAYIPSPCRNIISSDAMEKALRFNELQ